MSASRTLAFLVACLAHASAAARVQPATSPAALERIMALYESRRYGEAMALLPPLTASAPADVRLMGSRVLLAQARLDDAIAVLVPLVRTHATSTSHLWLARAYAAKAQVVNPLSAAGLARRARAEWDRAVTVDPSNVDARADLMRFLATAPRLVGGSAASARDQLADLKRRDPYRGALEEAWLARRSTQESVAETIYRDLVPRWPDRSEAHAQLTDLLVSHKEWDRAATTLDAWRRARPMDVAILYHAGRIAAGSGSQLDDGWNALSTYLTHPESRERPTHAAAHLPRAEIARRRGDSKQARAEAGLALAADPGSRAARQMVAELSR